jgi:hypothetical protein
MPGESLLRDAHDFDSQLSEFAVLPRARRGTDRDTRRGRKGQGTVAAARRIQAINHFPNAELEVMEQDATA